VNAIANSRAGAALAHALVLGGVKHAVISPGSRSTPLVLALHEIAKQGRLELHVVLDERSAAFFALGLARGSRSPVMIVATSGSAGAHHLPAVIEASESLAPLIVITADRPPELQGVGAPQTIDQSRLFGVHVRASIDLAVPHESIDPRSYSHAGARAILFACGPHPGPVHLNLPLREPLWSPETEPTFDSAPISSRRGRLTLHEADLLSLATELANASNGLITCGPMDEGPAFSSAISEIAAVLGWPILAEVGSQLRFGAHDRSSLIVHYDALLRSRAIAERLTPEIVLRFGRASCSRTLAEWLEKTGKNRVIAVDCGPHADPSHLAKELISSDPTELARSIAGLLRGRTPRDRSWLTRWREADRRASLILDRPASMLWEGSVAKEIAAIVPHGVAIHAGNGMAVRDLDAFAAPSKRTIRVFTSRGANGIDGTVSTAIGESVGAGSPLVVVLGDLAALHDLSGLRLLAEKPAPVAIVVLDNGGGGIFEFLPIASHASAFEPCFLTPQRTDLLRVAAAFGLESSRAESLSELSQAILRGVESRRPALIQVPIDRAQNVALHKERWSEVAAALDTWAAEAPHREARSSSWTSVS
jgi:2-succinyl-5-enolpyruvyl-6-hydroxy-3-cyclohexene-1-carboxylate synthase